jgi:hypothetical protein
MNDRRPDATSACLFLLLLVAPFEPRFTVPLGLFRLSLVEAVALPCFAVLAFGSRGKGWRSVGSPPLVALGLMVTASLFSASLAATDPGRALKFALRLGAMTTFAALVARRDERELTWGFRALALSGSGATLLALLEGGGVRSLDVFLGVFREIPFNVAGVRRASAGSEYPNPGAGMILYALLSGVTLLRARPWMRALFVLTVTLGLAFTYSRGAWLAGAAGLVVAAWFERGRARLAPLAAYLGVLGLFVGHEETSRIRFGGENANDFYAAVYEAPLRIVLDPSARTLVPVTVRNVGRKPWRTSDEIHLSYHLYQDPRRPLVDGPRTDLPRDVLQGEAASIEAILSAPLKPGEYLLLWDLVHEHTTWFSGQGVRPGVARLIVGAGSESVPAVSEDEALKAISDTLAWRPSRLDLWRIAVRMWAENPFLGVGPDNYRWTYGTMVGKTTFDTRVFANNMFLEFAATLGTFGLSAFMAALVLALRAGVLAAPRSPPALIALSILVAMTVHGLTDYLLAFTGHYLVFGFVVGALCRVAPDPELR